MSVEVFGSGAVGGLAVGFVRLVHFEFFEFGEQEPQAIFTEAPAMRLLPEIITELHGEAGVAGLTESGKRAFESLTAAGLLAPVLTGATMPVGGGTHGRGSAGTGS